MAVVPPPPSHCNHHHLLQIPLVTQMQMQAKRKILLPLFPMMLLGSPKAQLKGKKELCSLS